MHQLLQQLTSRDGLPEKCVLVGDEAGMADTRTLTTLLEHVERVQGKAILIGDPHQLPAVGAGGIYHHLCQQLDTIELTTNRRQHDPRERAALAKLRNGNPGPYLQHAAANHRLSTHADAIDAKTRLLADWWQTAQHDLAGSLMIAHTLRDVHDLNDAARALMLQHGRLGSDSRELSGLEFRVGDRVICRRNNTRLAVRNGTRATIIQLNSEDLAIQTDGGDTRTIPLDYGSRYLQHGYATTAHAIQGATLNHAHVLLNSATLTREWAYTALTRARHNTRLHVVDTDPSRDPAPTPGQASGSDQLARAIRRRTPDKAAAITHSLGR